MTHRLQQIPIVSAIVKEVCKQFKAAGKGSPPSLPHQMNAAIEAANLVVAAFEREEVKAKPGSGLDAWISSDDTGLSSCAMSRRIFGRPGGALRDDEAWPRDQDDFGRCHRFLESVPEARGKLHLLKDLNPVWDRLVQHWDELTELYLQELPDGRAPILYARMKELGC